MPGACHAPCPFGVGTWSVLRSSAMRHKVWPGPWAFMIRCQVSGARGKGGLPSLTPAWALPP